MKYLRAWALIIWTRSLVDEIEYTKMVWQKSPVAKAGGGQTTEIRRLNNYLYSTRPTAYYGSLVNT